MPAGTYGAGNMLQYLLMGATATRVTTCWVGLSTVSPSIATPGEFTDASYARRPCVFTSTGINSYRNSAAVSFSTPATTKTASGVLIYDASTAGNLLLYGVLNAASSVGGGVDFASFAAGSLLVVLS